MHSRAQGASNLKVEKCLSEELSNIQLEIYIKLDQERPFLVNIFSHSSKMIAISRNRSFWVALLLAQYLIHLFPVTPAQQSGDRQE